MLYVLYDQENVIEDETLCLLRLICLIVAFKVTSFEDFNISNFSLSHLLIHLLAVVDATHI
jgi:hypothetical protein